MIILNSMLKNTNKSRFYDQQIFNQGKRLAEEKSKKKAGQFFKVLVLFFLAIVLLTLVVQIPSLLGKIQKPFSFIQSKFAIRGDINTQHRTNILLVGQVDKKVTELGFISLEKGDRKVKLITIDPTVKIETLSQTSSFSKRAFTNGNLNIDRLEASLMLAVGYFFDGYIVVNDKINWINQASLEKLIDNFFSPGFFLKLGSSKDYLDRKMKTSITLDKATNLIWFSKGLTPERVTLVDLTKSIDSQGNFDSQSSANKIGLLLSDNNISKEEAAVEIENSSSVPGVGSILKAVVTNLGGNVLSVTKSEELEKSRILVKNKDSLLAKRLETILGIKMEKISKNDSIEGDIKLKIGNDFASFFDF